MTAMSTFMSIDRPHLQSELFRPALQYPSPTVGVGQCTDRWLQAGAGDRIHRCYSSKPLWKDLATCTQGTRTAEDGFVSTSGGTEFIRN